MATKKGQLKKNIWRWFKKMQVIYLATARGTKPQVRPVTMIHFKNKFWVTTGTRDAKVKQIRKNSNIQFCLPIKRGKYSGYIRSDCRARIVRDRKTKRSLAVHLPFFKQFWKKVDDPNFTVIELVMKRIEYMQPRKFLIETYKV